MVELDAAQAQRLTTSECSRQLVCQWFKSPAALMKITI
jgi:hypothetical protein